jgi:hypothetical protein
MVLSQKLGPRLSDRTFSAGSSPPARIDESRRSTYTTRSGLWRWYALRREQERDK